MTLSGTLLTSNCPTRINGIKLSQRYQKIFILIVFLGLFWRLFLKLYILTNSFIFISLSHIFWSGSIRNSQFNRIVEMNCYFNNSYTYILALFVAALHKCALKVYSERVDQTISFVLVLSCREQKIQTHKVTGSIQS